MTKFAAAALSIFLLLASTAADAAAWTVGRSSGPVTISSAGAQKVNFGSATELPNGATVTTGKTGRVLLLRGKETMTIGPNTTVTIPADGLFGRTTIIQHSGQIAFDVEKRNVRHFAVTTPFLAAVVKGTRFTVRVTRSGASVSVERGRVGVTDNATGQSADILPGQSAKVATGTAGLSLIGVPANQEAAQRAAGAGFAPVLGSSQPGSSQSGKDKSNKGDGGNGNGNGGGNGNAGGNGNSGPGNNGNGGGNGNSGNGNGNSGSGSGGNGNNGNGNSGNGNGNGNGNSGG
jgi:hypothetical protein